MSTNMLEHVKAPLLFLAVLTSNKSLLLSGIVYFYDTKELPRSSTWSPSIILCTTGHSSSLVIKRRD